MWKDLPPPLKTVLPSDMKYTYVVEQYTAGATEHNFSANIRINITQEEEAKQWLQDMFDYSKTTYRVTRTYKVLQKRVLYRVDMHCQHKQKALSIRQKGQKALSKKKTNPLMGDLRNKKTKCQSKLTLKIVEPTKKELSRDIFNSHKMKIQLLFEHNHSLTSAHALSFRPVSNEAKEKYDKLFQSGHSAASARHYYETTLMDACEEEELQTKMSDRSINPLLQDVSRLYNQWRLSEYGTDSNGKDLARSLIQEVELYNSNHKNEGGKANIQVYDAGSGEESSDTDTDFKPKKPKKKKMSTTKPLIITACTPLMARVHQNVQQAGELIFCDSTSCLEKYNCSLFILSTSSPAGGLPLGVAITSDEKKNTIKKALQLLLGVLPQGAFYGKKGPQVVMIDDSATEREAISQIWPRAYVLLCSFHFLQRRWTWLYDSKNKIEHEHRTILIGKIKELLYSKSEKELIETYSKFCKDNLVLKYPNFKRHMESQWSRRCEWAICFRNNIMTRGNNTNNIAEAGIRIIKELIFGRIKAYNLIQMFQFVTDSLETYITRKLLSIAHNRFNHFISTKYKGLLADKINKASIVVLNSQKKMYQVHSSKEGSTVYTVDMDIGTCSCKIGTNGSPCSHQAAIVFHFHTKSINFVPTLNPSLRQEIGFLALGGKARQDINFYTSLHENVAPTTTNTANTNTANTSDFTGSSWDVVRAGALDDNNDDTGVTEILDSTRKRDLLDKIDSMAETMKHQLDSNDPQLVPGIEKFLVRFHDLSALRTTGCLASALHTFGTEARRGVSLACGKRRWGKRIGVQATASGRRKYGSRGKAQVTAGRPRSSYVCKVIEKEKHTRYTIPTRKKNQVEKKRPHNLSLNISLGKQNAGKW